uniref:NADH dehydrogenase [ubiquinone] 1 subunit C1, mitochondrial n=1 Tax=Apteryx owenii TaxID=8824 RepID=A0A8B9PI57_APTOW
GEPHTLFSPFSFLELELFLTRSAFFARKPNYDRPNWFGVGLAFSTTAALWVLLFKQHNEDVMEYERRQKERHHKCTGCS